jgi:hydroxymethylpyrimidine/phosphomethylpyrimidine kinase|tara:strand:- start:325 stop:612 length:288 start_codon:yes stop_codon:yes gene_type:complete
MFVSGNSQINSVMVKTSNNGGLSNDDLADICVSKVISIADTAPPEIKEQAVFFKDKIKSLLKYYLNQASESEKSRCAQICVNGGHEEAANLIRRL